MTSVQPGDRNFNSPVLKSGLERVLVAMEKILGEEPTITDTDIDKFKAAGEHSDELTEKDF